MCGPTHMDHMHSNICPLFTFLHLANTFIQSSSHLMQERSEQSLAEGHITWDFELMTS